MAAATMVGVVFGTVPATRAAQMDPVDALKYE
jgi:putative ABC transport system permease protein